MILYERVTFFLVVGTGALFLAAVLLALWGIVTTFYPGLNALVLSYIRRTEAYIRPYARKATRYAVGAWKSFRQPVQPA